MILVWTLLLAGQLHTPPPCTQAGPRAIDRCAQRDFVNAERDMSREFNGAISRIRNCRPRNSTACMYRPRAISVVTREQQSWTAWRDAHCDVVAFGMEGSSGEFQVRMDCRTGLTRQRINELRAIGRSRN